MTPRGNEDSQAHCWEHPELQTLESHPQKQMSTGGSPPWQSRTKNQSAAPAWASACVDLEGPVCSTGPDPRLTPPAAGHAAEDAEGHSTQQVASGGQSHLLGWSKCGTADCRLLNGSRVSRPRSYTLNLQESSVCCTRSNSVTLNVKVRTQTANQDSKHRQTGTCHSANDAILLKAEMNRTQGHMNNLNYIKSCPTD